MGRSILSRLKQTSAAAPVAPAIPDQQDADRDAVALAIACSHDGRHAEAIRLLSAVARRHPADASVQADLAMAQLAAGQLEDAVWGFSEALRLDERCAQAQCGLGLAYRRLDRWREAAEAFRLTEALAPDQPVGPFNLGLTLHALGEHEEARRALLRAAKLAPQDPEIRAALETVSAAPARAESPAPLARFTGDLGSFGLPEVLELMRAQRKTGTLVISSRQGAGIVRLVRGRLTNVSSPATPRTGERSIAALPPAEAALRKIVEGLAGMLSWREGAFSFHPSAETDVPPISFDTQQVVMELFRVAEEPASRRFNLIEEDR